MATSMQFGPEWMRKAPVKNSSTNSIGREASSSPSSASAAASARADTGSVAPGSAPTAGKRNGAISGGGGGIPNGPTPVTSPTVTSPGAFSFAAAAGGAASAAAAGPHHQALGASSQDGDGIGSSSLSNGAASAKERQSREKLLSLYSTDRSAKNPSSEASPLDQNGSASDKAIPSVGRKKNGDRDQRRPSNLAELGAGAGPLSPSLGGELRGINARSTSGGSSGGFGSAGTSNWDRADKERPGLFQRASSSALTGAASTAGARPLSPSIPRERFGGIQGGVLSGVGPQSRKRMDSDNGSTAASRGAAKPAPAPEEVSSPSLGGGQPGRGGAVFSDAFSSNKIRGKLSAGDVAGGAVGQEAEGGSESGGLPGRFVRSRDRQPGEGPIGPPADGSAGFNKFAGYDRKRERQASHIAKGSGETDANGHSADDSDGAQHNQGATDGSGGGAGGDGRDERLANANDSSMDSDLVHHATAVLGSLKLDEDDTSAHMLSSDPPKPTPPTWSAETAFWLYRDLFGQVQGPFTGLIMQEWYRQSYFSDDLLVRREQDPEFKPLAHVIAIIGNALQPFLVPPHSWLQNPDVVNEPHGTADTRRSSLAGGGGESKDLTGANARLGQDHDAIIQEGSRFADQMDAAGSAGWNGALQGQQQWPPQLNLGFGTTAPQPMSPFARQDIFGGQGGSDNRFRTQEELVALIRERELQEQRQAAAAAAARGQSLGYGQLDPFMGVLGGRGGWDAPGAANWAPHGGLPSFDPAFTGHLSPLIAERQTLEAFNQRGAGGPDQSGAWAKGPLTPRSHFEHPNPFNNRASQWEGPAGGWSQGNMTPETPNRQIQNMQESAFRNDNVKPFSDPIGTPRRARSPAAASPALDQGFETFNTDKPAAASHEESISGSVQKDEPLRAAANDDGARGEEAASTAEEVKQEATEARRNEPAAEAPSVSAPVVEEEPGPEQLWPQSPKAVEFASEPELSSMSGMSLSGKPQATGGASRERRAAQRAEAQAEQAKRSAARQTSAAGNVRVVSQEQFLRAKEDSANLNQVLLSAWLPDDAGEPATPTAKPAPWAARDDAPAASSPGPSLREIQEAEAKRVELRKAAGRAAAAQRAKATSSAAASSDDLPTSMSWGLASVPSTRSMASNSDLPLTPTSAGSPSAPAWSSGKAAAPKKMLMEIQDEERRRAEKQKQQQVAQAIALRKGYADSASRTAVPSATATVGGAWSVVGAGGKSSAPSPPPSHASAVTATSRPSAPTAQRTASVGVVPGAGSGWTTAGAKPAASSATAVAAAPATPTRIASQTAVASTHSSALKPKPAPSVSSLDVNQPSPEFVRYLKENLKGLTIRLDDFIEMLMSFPLDPSPDVIEIIAESVYANSSTLDGRRFAADFVSKRKMDTQGRQQSVYQTGSASSSSSSSMGGNASSSAPFQSKWSAAGSSGGMGSFGSGATGGGVGRGSGSSVFGGGRSGATSPQMTCSAADVMKGQGSSTKAGADTFGGFKVVKAKGNKKRGN